MNQPTKDALREQLALAADEIIRLRGRVVDMSTFHTPEQSEAMARRHTLREWMISGPVGGYVYPESLPPRPWWRRLFS